ncbi:putative tail assembly chaperone gp38 [Burkholderia thailandensis 34]|uniref:phage tail assembly chaperone n=1 Tax=Burkholderia thailandensis TaxID=57975 RepID=UPI0005D9F170|nr:phage tail assembly chaperone [Burkholderia thailandensis]AJY30913.1 putative tail assembly chaperone gp38 [Burkholderia thailandensis 34]AOJ59213.1 phage tail protein [Burkholderia thailandensis]KXF58332.1 phage tail protein [Burkholderia thailandensis]PNE76908.1 phage tail protein [Burkholderia thailandensis]
MTTIFATYDNHRNITGFYGSASHIDTGERFVEVTFGQRDALIAGQAAGMRMTVDAGGNAALLDPPPPSREQLASAKRAARDAAMRSTDWLIARHQDEKLIGNGTTLAPDEFLALLRYRQALRDFTEISNWPNVDLPTPPAFVAAST